MFDKRIVGEKPKPWLKRAAGGAAKRPEPTANAPSHKANEAAAAAACLAQSYKAPEPGQDVKDFLPEPTPISVRAGLDCRLCVF